MQESKSTSQISHPANPPFEKFPKIPRLNRQIIVTEKIDGTNGTIYFDDDLNMSVASRNRWLSEDKDNYGFWKWAHEHEEELRELGPGWHRGEWWGQGIQRGYDMDRKVFSLFNVSKWSNGGWSVELGERPESPACCDVVPVMSVYHDFKAFADEWMEDLDYLRRRGSWATGRYTQKYFPNPEGLVIYHVAAKQYFKVTLEGDEKPKGSKE